MELLSVLPEAVPSPLPLDPDIARIRQDSREVLPGDLFVAIAGERCDGFDFVPGAVARGAAAVVSDRPAPANFPSSVAWVKVESPRRALALLAARCAGDPAEKLVLAGITGTNGKTTTTALVSSVLARRYGGAGFLGTVGYRTGSREMRASRTTPEAPLLQELLAEMVTDGFRAAALEVSSHALTLDRVLGCRFDVVVLTNLTRDHLDFHGDMESYYQAKKTLFDLRKSGAAAVVNADDPWGRRLAREVEPPVLTYSASGAPADVRAGEIRSDLEGTSFDVIHAKGRFRLTSPLLGRLNAENLLAAAAAALALDTPESDIASGCAALRRVPGRLERVEAGQPYTILVDYAHTEDALERLLTTVRDLTEKKIVLVFGCGGDRDRGKRFPMGKIAGRLADIAIATSDNPRSEDPEAILSEVASGLAASGATKSLLIADRAEAIRTAIGFANPGVVVVIAGKGHETVQVLGEREIPFDDRAVAAAFAKRR